MVRVYLVLQNTSKMAASFLFFFFYSHIFCEVFFFSTFLFFFNLNIFILIGG